jgi:uncharacterized protein YdeI (YjbR/CyaY-like superfamily)
MEAFFKHREEWRKWLAANSDREVGIWVVYFKISSGKESISYEEAVEEALCFGWIDGKIKRIDEDRYQQWFAPRRRGSRWSASNIRRVEKLVGEGKMETAGLNSFRELIENPSLAYDISALPHPEMPVDLDEALKANTKAREFFLKLSPASRRLWLRWLESAKREETRMSRIKKIVSQSEANIKPGIM